MSSLIKECLPLLRDVKVELTPAIPSRRLFDYLQEGVQLLESLLTLLHVC